ncbi:uncharacterized protein N7477_004978 [Penicillium maclennaniae]|uniref:uncharacterized protein n=1 Tax=Penicillium maclennaniae TaxID=1343394 RepID=UPI00253F9899|nr:uncharacterized protein N7477_004978 [Penicillium maclennaniae]KAJ5675044.1 hypothetical protein N7477_004978 [Penicillium maclennaniae]
MSEAERQRQLLLHSRMLQEEMGRSCLRGNPIHRTIHKTQSDNQLVLTARTSNFWTHGLTAI